MQKIILASIMLVLSLGYAEAKSHHKHYAKHHHGKGTTSLAGFPAPLVSKVHELQSSCGSRVISAFRPGARVAGSGHISNHALKKAVDMAGNPKCIYAHLKGWPGGYSIDYGSVNHVHISYNPRMEWGVRFAHYGHSARRYAHRHHHRAHYAAG